MFIRAALTILVVGTAAAYVLVGAREPWDFETYYYAATAHRAGLNPYSLDALSTVAHKTVELPFLYPPAALAVFIPLSMLPIGIAAGAWLGFKSLLVVSVLWLWRRDFLGSIDLTLLIGATLLGFNLAVLWDLRTGNVALIETVLLWLAFSNYLRGRVALTVYLIAVASIFKLFPILLLGIVGMAPRPPRVRLALIALGLAALLGTVAAPVALFPEWLRGLKLSFADTRPAGGINPSALGLADWLANKMLPMAAAPTLAFGLYLVYCAAILILSLGQLLRARASGSRIEQVVLAVLLWLLTLPRLMVYSYTMALVPVLYVFQTRIHSRAGRWVAMGSIFMEGLIRLLPGRPPAMLGPISFAILLSAWALCVGVAQGRQPRVDSRRARC